MAAEVGPVAVFGAGPMGYGIADRLLRSGIRTVLCGRDAATTKLLTTRGAAVADTVSDAASQAAVAITIVPDIDALLSIVDEQGMLDALPTDAIWAQMSTIGVDGIERVAKLLESRRPDVTLVDAPVPWTRDPREQGRLTIFASGPESAQARIAPIFDAFAPRTVWMGPVGLGSRMTVVNSTLLAFTAEAVGLARSLAPELSLALALKDVGLALDAAGHAGSPVLAQLAGSWNGTV